MLKPPETVARDKAAVRVAPVMPVPPLRGAVTGATSLPARGGGAGIGWAIVADDALMAGTVTMPFRFLRYRAWRWAPVGSFGLGRSSVMLSVICVPYFQNVLQR